MKNTVSINIDKLENIIGYIFSNREMISVAISHPGVRRGKKDSTRKFERLEFLGDRVLGLSLCDFLYRNFKEESEGNLAIRMAMLAGTDFLINLAKKTKIIECFCIPKDFFISSNKNSSSIADMMEAVFGAIFLDSNFDVVKKIIANLWKEDFTNVMYSTKDVKTRLQEIVQARSGKLPVYRLVKMVGEAHDPIFEMEVSVWGKSCIGCGNSKRNAEHAAAEKMLALITVDENSI